MLPVMIKAGGKAIGVALVLLSGCATISPEEYFTLSDQIKPPSLSLPKPSQSKPPESRHAEAIQAWLNSPTDAVYKDIPATLALSQIVGAYPVRMLFEPDADPKVRGPASALTIRDHLQGICSQSDWSYSFADGVLLVNDVETKIFRLASQPGTSNARLQLRNLGSGDSQQAAGAENNLTVDLDPYAEEVMEILQATLGFDVAVDTANPSADRPDAASVDESPESRTRVALLPSANAVLVTTKPHLMRLVDRALEEYIAATSRMVQVRITFFEVDRSKSNERSLNLNLMRMAAGAFGLSVQPGESTTSPSALSLSFKGGWADSSAVARWLNTTGKTTISFEDSIEVRNNAVASLDVVRTRQYVRSITRSQQLVGSTTLNSPEVEFDQLRVGWSIHIQPTIADDLITLRIGLSRSDYVDEVPYSFDEGRIAGTHFVLDEYHRMMAVSVADGETRLITSMANKESRLNKRSTPFLPWVGDSRRKVGRERDTVMMLSVDLI